MAIGAFLNNEVKRCLQIVQKYIYVPVKAETDM